MSDASSRSFTTKGRKIVAEDHLRDIFSPKENQDSKYFELFE